MRIAIVSQCFFPEEFKVNDLVVQLVKRGHEVLVLTGKPNYPKGEYFPGYGFKGTVKETYRGADVIRVPVVKRGKGSAFRLIINYLSFVFHACRYVIFHKTACDAVLCFAPSPIIQVYPALLLGWKNKCKVSLWYQDLWPESIYATVGGENKLTDWILTKMVKHIYRHVDHLMVPSPSFGVSILEAGDFADKIRYIPNWAEDFFVSPEIDRKKHAELLPEGFIIMYAGNIGEAQDIEAIVNAISLTSSNENIHWVFLGDGRKREFAETLVKQKGLTHCAHFLGRYPITEMPSFFVHANVMVVSLKKKRLFSLTIPSRIQTYMAFGKPVLSMLSGIGNEIIKKANCGLTAESGDFAQLAKNVLRLADGNNEELARMGANGKYYYDLHFRQEAVVDRIEATLHS